ncbi:MAG: phosphoribosylanthranilate isomerase [Verrucomicrobiota bacterium]
MTLLERFLDPTAISLKICGITRHSDATQLAALGVHALGVNFWPGSKRYLPPADAAWLLGLAGHILRVGVFVNAPVELPLRLMRDGWLDVIQLHGDETPADAAAYRAANIQFIKAIGVQSRADLVHASDYGSAAILLDAHAPGVYGGTGEVFDWNVAAQFREQHPALPLILAGGIVADNAALAARRVRPAALDVASGAELAPGIKDFAKVQALLDAVKTQ